MEAVYVLVSMTLLIVLVFGTISRAISGKWPFNEKE